MAVYFFVISAICGLSDFIVSAGADKDVCNNLYLVVEGTFCRRVHCTDFNSEYTIYPLVVAVFVIMAILYGKVCRRLRATLFLIRYSFGFIWTEP